MSLSKRHKHMRARKWKGCSTVWFVDNKNRNAGRPGGKQRGRGTNVSQGDFHPCFRHNVYACFCVVNTSVCVCACPCVCVWGGVIRARQRWSAAAGFRGVWAAPFAARLSPSLCGITRRYKTPNKSSKSHMHAAEECEHVHKNNPDIKYKTYIRSKCRNTSTGMSLHRPGPCLTSAAWSDQNRVTE